MHLLLYVQMNLFETDAEAFLLSMCIAPILKINEDSKCTCKVAVFETFDKIFLQSPRVLRSVKFRRTGKLVKLPCEIPLRSTHPVFQNKQQYKKHHNCAKKLQEVSLSRCAAYTRLYGLARYKPQRDFQTIAIKFPPIAATEIEIALDEHNMCAAAAHQHLSLCTCMGFQHNQQHTTLLTTRIDKTKTDKILLNTHPPHNSWLINKKYYLQMKDKQNVTNWSSIQQSLV